MIYILEDDAQIRAMEEYALKAAGFDVKSFAGRRRSWPSWT